MSGLGIVRGCLIRAGFAAIHAGERRGPGRHRRWLSACAVAAILLAIPAPVLADEGTAAVLPAQPQLTDAGKAYLGAVEGLRLQTEIRYLSPDADLDAAEDASRRQLDADPGAILARLEWGSKAVLVLMVLLLVLLLWLGRGQLADLMGPRDRRLGPAGATVIHRPDGELDHDLIARLRREGDPRQGLRQVLERFLELAAEDNAIVLKRSLTTRELVQRLPGSWSHRAELESLARQTELVLFGGREMDIASYHRCLDVAAPFLRRTVA
ncbi:DUF4129 domain-containing protein [Aurantimonas sp. 22II-16-19i]|uniref:DUF4129 domain-containing protein n=1 Tax=Aurantimonas sp. 22II-16-19i TaxID=1317114 RepID=UPI0009F7DF91|nr:DUF4129 domain-containing protein [Aurantimonas sp. 22II-16-19i]ORE97640.1 hypothetical protein ATO4_08475 [Aurantimonas sp. 22II-16-19i]